MFKSNSPKSFKLEKISINIIHLIPSLTIVSEPRYFQEPKTSRKATSQAHILSTSIKQSRGKYDAVAYTKHIHPFISFHCYWDTPWNKLAVPQRCTWRILGRNSLLICCTNSTESKTLITSFGSHTLSCLCHQSVYTWDLCPPLACFAIRPRDDVIIFKFSNFLANCAIQTLAGAWGFNSISFWSMNLQTYDQMALWSAFCIPWTTRLPL